MKKYGILINSQTGVPVRNTGFQELEIPSGNILPLNTEVVIFTNSTPDFNLLQAFFFTDPDRLTTEYKQPIQGGVVYDFNTKSFNFHKEDYSIKLDDVKFVRNQLLSNTDKYMLIPDLPQSIKNDVVAYRTALRNITDKVGTEWKTVFDVQWPEFPSKLIRKPVVPPQV